MQAHPSSAAVSGGAPGANGAARDREDSRVFALLWQVQMSHLCHQLHQKVNAIFRIPPPGNVADVAEAAFRSRARLWELLLLLGDVRRRGTTRGVPRGAPAAWVRRGAALGRALDEFVLLAGTLVDEEDSTRAAYARPLVEDVLLWTRRQFPPQRELNPSPPVQPRRDVAKSLLSAPAPDALRCPTVPARRIAFQVFRSRAMTLAAWHEQYFDLVTELGDDAASANEAVFFFAVYELIHCGFMRKVMSARRNEEAYEKVAIVWGSGR